MGWVGKLVLVGAGVLLVAMLVWSALQESEFAVLRSIPKPVVIDWHYLDDFTKEVFYDNGTRRIFE